MVSTSETNSQELRYRKDPYTDHNIRRLNIMDEGSQSLTVVVSQ